MKTFLKNVIVDVIEKKLIIFTWDKKDDASFRTILNLKYLNLYVRYKYFWNGVSEWCSFIKQNVSMVSWPQRGLFLTVPVNTGYRKYFKFEWLIKILYNYCHAKLVFSWEYLQKLLKPVHECLEEEGRNFLSHLLKTLINQLTVN